MTAAPADRRSPAAHVAVRAMTERDLDAADRVQRLAFGTFLGLPDPASFKGDAGFVRTRFRADPAAAFVAETAGEIIGSNFATNWGSVGLPGPMSVLPAHWHCGVGSRLMDPVHDCFRRWHTTEVLSFTYAHSARHIGWYQTMGQWPHFLTAVMSARVDPPAVRSAAPLYSQVADDQRPGVLAESRDLTDALYPGLDVTVEIRAVADQGLGDTVLLWDNSRLTAFAVCHCGPGTEAGANTCFVKFGAVRPGPSAARAFLELLTSCEALATARGLGLLVAGVNTSRVEAYGLMLARGFRIQMLGVGMRTGPGPGFDRPDVYVLNDCR